MTRTQVLKTAETIARQLRSAGFQIEHSGSSLSASRYVTASMYDDHDSAIVESFKIRISDHDLPPSYGSADYDVGPHGLACSDWTRVIIRLCERAGVAVPAATKALVTRQQRIAAKSAARRAEDAAKWAPIAAAKAARTAWVDAEMDRRGTAELRGKARKDERYKLGKVYDRDVVAN